MGMLILTILRGLPGSGKSTKISQAKRRPLVLSADHWFYRDGVYQFNPSEIGKAHSECQRQCILAMAAKEPWIAIDNTNTQLWEMDVYLTLAFVNGYQTEIIDLYDGNCTDDELAKRNLHNVPVTKIAQMRSRYERSIPDLEDYRGYRVENNP